MFTFLIKYQRSTCYINGKRNIIAGSLFLGQNIENSNWEITDVI